MFDISCTVHLSVFAQALQEEMKHTEQYSNAGPGTYGTSIKVKVDQKALEEVSMYTHEHIKLDQKYDVLCI